MILAAALALGAGCRSEPPTPVARGVEPRPAAPSDPATPVLIRGGTLLTMDAAGTVIEDGVLLVVDGRIAALGEAADIAVSDAFVVDATGAIVMPGLINAHTHAPMALFRGLADDLPLTEWLQSVIFPAEAQFVDEEFVRWGTRLACLEMLRGGTTTFVDMYYFEDAIAEEANRCGMRAVLGETLIDFPAPDNQTWDEAVAYTRRFVERWKGHPRITPAVAPHAPYTVSSDHLREGGALAVELDVPLLVHLAEDRSEVESTLAEHGLRPVEYVDSLGLLEDRVLAAHMIYPEPAEIATLAARGVGVAHCPESNMKIGAGIAPVPELLEAGVAVGLGTDGAASNNNLDLWQEIDTAAKLHKVDHLDPTKIDARRALALATSLGAAALDMEDEIGSLEVGKRADIIVVDLDGFHQQPVYDPYSVLTYATRADSVDTVLVEGRIVVADGRVLTLEADEILAIARRYRDRISSHLGR
jgi:5-methylthioadenosine/S-adenosylhomocysteine deaminase